MRKTISLTGLPDYRGVLIFVLLTLNGSDKHKKIALVLSTIDSNISFHDLRLVAGPTHTNVLFDIVIPNNKNVDSNIIQSFLTKEFCTSDKQYNFIFKIDSNYID